MSQDAKAEAEYKASLKKEPEIEDLHKAIAELKEETSETLVEVKTAVDVGEKKLQAGPGSVYGTPEYFEFVQRGQEVQQAIEEAPATISLLSEAPAGYYYREEDVQRYNLEVREHNRRLRKYKRELQEAQQEYSAGLIAYDVYEAERKVYEAEMERTAPQREAFGEYLRTIGPPEPTEEQRIRIEAGMPVTGLPGPAAVPPPGSIAAKIQPIVQEGFEKTMGIMEMPFKAVTKPIRGLKTEFEAESLKAMLEGKPVLGFGYYTAGTAARVLAAGIDVATFEYRPGLWVDVARTVTGLAVSPEARTAVVGEIARDPFGFAAEMAGGAYLGGQLRKLPHTLYKETKLDYQLLRAQRGDVSEGLYGPSVKEATYGKFWAERRAIKDIKYRETYAAKTTDITELKFLEEAGITEFPKETVFTDPTYRAYEKKWLKITGDKGGPSFELPYYGKVRAETPSARVFDAPGEKWRLEQLGDTLDTAVPYEFGGEGGFLYVKGGYGGMKPFAEAKPAPAARAETLVITAKAAPTTPLSKTVGMPTARLETRLDFIPDIETLLGHRAGFKFIMPETIKSPSAFKPMSIGTLALLDLIKVKRITPAPIKRPVQIQKLVQMPRLDPIKIQKLDLIQIQKPRLETRQIQKPVQIQKPIQPQRQRQIQKLDLIQIQEPRLDYPQLLMPEVPQKPIPIIPYPPFIKPPRTPRKLPHLPSKRKRAPRRRRKLPSMGWEMKEYRMPMPKDFTKLKTQKKKKGRGLPKL